MNTGTHPKQTICDIDTVKTLDAFGYYVTSEGWWTKRYHLMHRELDYPLFSHDDISHVVAKGLAYLLVMITEHHDHPKRNT